MFLIGRHHQRGRWQISKDAGKLICKTNEAQPNDGVTSSRGRDSATGDEDQSLGSMTHDHGLILVISTQGVIARHRTFDPGLTKQKKKVLLATGDWEHGCLSVGWSQD